MSCDKSLMDKKVSRSDDGIYAVKMRARIDSMSLSRNILLGGILALL